MPLDPLGRLTSATTKLGGVAKRALAYAYDAAGNLKSKTSSVGADIDVSAYAHHASKPHRLASATIGGESHKFVHDADGNIEKYDCVPATCDDRFVEWSGRNLPVRITVGCGKTYASQARSRNCRRRPGRRARRAAADAAYWTSC